MAPDVGATSKKTQFSAQCPREVFCAKRQLNFVWRRFLTSASCLLAPFGANVELKETVGAVWRESISLHLLFWCRFGPHSFSAPLLWFGHGECQLIDAVSIGLAQNIFGAVMVPSFGAVGPLGYEGAGLYYERAGL